MAVMAHRPLCGLLTWRVARANRSIALTFDDGPNPAFTPQVLELLAPTRATATFFVLGVEVERYPNLVRRILSEGHEIGLHGYDHSLQGLPSQMERTIEILASLDARPRSVRPPGGRLSAGLLRWSITRRLPLVLWSFDLEDSRRYESKALRRRPFSELAAGDIVLMHDDNPLCIEELSELLRILREKSLEPVRVSDLLGR